MQRALLLMAAAFLSLGAGEPSFNERLLAAHNKARAEFGSPPLRWNAALASDAATWARTMASAGEFEHADQSRQGENLWMGTTQSYPPEAMVGSWIDERKLFKAGRFSNNSTTGNWQDVGHYTQLVWPGTTDVGCALASGGGDDYLVCRYSPAGNIIGEDLGPKAAVAPPAAPPTKKKKRNR